MICSMKANAPSRTVNSFHAFKCKFSLYESRTLLLKKTTKAASVDAATKTNSASLLDSALESLLPPVQ
jgi:hypothetical protein